MKQFYYKLKIIVVVLLCCFMPSLLMAQIKLSGTVTDESHQSLPGVSIKVKESGKGAVTDIEGHYIISATPGQTLIFSYIGFNQQQVIVTDKTVIDITLAGSSKNLNEVVVTALGIKKSTRTIGYATQTVNGGDLTTARRPKPYNRSGRQGCGFISWAICRIAG